MFYVPARPDNAKPTIDTGDLGCCAARLKTRLGRMCKKNMARVGAGRKRVSMPSWCSLDRS